MVYLTEFTPYWNFLVLGNTVLTTLCCFPKKMLSVFQKMNSKRLESNTEQQIIMMQETLITNLGTSFPPLTPGECLSIPLSY